MAKQTSQQQTDAYALPLRTVPPAIELWVRPFMRFMQIEASGGMLLLVCTVLALLISNSPWAAGYESFWKTPVILTIGEFQLKETLAHLVNDGLMTIFFFVVGLEIKRELVVGELRDLRKAALPAFGAVGGMVVPAFFYFLLQQEGPGSKGWGIPMATDIAFVVGFLTLLGTRVPPSLKIMLLSLAIVDDIGAILVIAIFYSSNLSWLALGLAMLGLAFTYLFNWIGVRRVPIYVFIGILIWLAFLKSGIHPTICGVLLGLLTPASAWIGDKGLLEVMQTIFMRSRDRDLKNDQILRQHEVGPLSLMVTETIPPLERLEYSLHPWVAFVIIPLFALANAAVQVKMEYLFDAVSFAVAFGLVLGKPIGIVLFCWLGVKLNLARFPAVLNWKIMVGAGCLGGIGFTMSLFIAHLALTEPWLSAAKLGTLSGSLISMILGMGILWWTLPGGGKAGSTAS